MRNKNTKGISWGIGILSLLILLAIDQLTKYLAVVHLAGQESKSVISGVLELQYLENRGAAFGMLQNRQGFFIVMTAVVIILIAVCYHKLPMNRHYTPLRVISILLAAGALGNMIDRAFRGFVVDFFYCTFVDRLIGFDFPIFNVADCYVVVSMIALIIFIFFYYKEEDFAFLSKKKTEDRSNGND